MKTHLFANLSAGIAILLMPPIFAIEAPADNAPPPQVMIESDSLIAEGNDPSETQQKNTPENPKIAFLGVEVTEIPEILAEHLDIQSGTAVVVKSLHPDSPAIQAGITVNDVITQIDGKPIESPLDLSKNISSHNPNDSIHLDIIHKGKAKALDLKLTHRPNFPKALGDLEEENPRLLDEIPKELQQHLGDIKKRIQLMELQLDGIGGVEINPNEQGMQKRNQMKIDKNHSFQMKAADGEGSVELSSKDDGKEITVRDHQNNITWTGPWDTEQDKAAAPAEIRERIERLNIDNP